jgi:purine-cytosine permease-like protein
MTDRNHAQGTPGHRTIHVFGRRFHMPRSRALRVLIGVLLVFFGFLGFLPVLGFWMVPLGLLILSYEFHVVRRLRRKTIVWWEKRQRAKQGK